MKKTNKRFFLGITVLALMATGLVFAAQDSKAFFETPSSFEENHYDCELDFWLNTTGTLTPLSVKEGNSWQMLHARYSFSDRETLANIYGYDIFTTEFFLSENLDALYVQNAYAHLVSDVKGIQTLQVIEIQDDNSPGEYWAVGGGATQEIIKPITEADFYDNQATTSYKMNFTQAFDDTSLPTLDLETGNLKTKDDSSQFFGVIYTASDAMSINDYATAICAMNGVTLYDIANASTIQWLMQDSIDKAEMNFISINFQDMAASVSPGLSLQAGVLRNYAFSMFSRVKDNIVSTASRIKENLLTRIPTSRVISGITSVPSGAGYYDKSTIGTTWFTKIFGVSAAAGGLQNTVAKIFGTIFSGTGLIIAGLAYGGIGIFRAFKGRKFLFNPFKRGWFK